MRDGRNDEAPGCGRTEPSESESGVVGDACPGSRPLRGGRGARGIGGGNRSNIVSGRQPEVLSVASRCASRGGDSAGIYQVEEVSIGRVRIQVGLRDRSDEMRSVKMRGRSPCLEFRGALGDTRVSDCWFRGVAKTKFRVSRAVATWDARTLSTATRLFTNSTDNCMVNEITARPTQARKAAEQHNQLMLARLVYIGVLRTFCRCLSVNGHMKDQMEHAGVALTAGGGFGMKVRWSDVEPVWAGRPRGRLWWPRLRDRRRLHSLEG